MLKSPTVRAMRTRTKTVIIIDTEKLLERTTPYIYIIGGLTLIGLLETLLG